MVLASSFYCIDSVKHVQAKVEGLMLPGLVESGLEGDFYYLIMVECYEDRKYAAAAASTYSKRTHMHNRKCMLRSVWGEFNITSYTPSTCRSFSTLLIVSKSLP